jgi:hypothetical protein
MLAILLRIEINVDVFIFSESEIEIERKDEVRVDRWFLDDKVVEMSIAMPHVVVIEKPPVNPFLAEDSFDLSHLPPQLL